MYSFQTFAVLGLCLSGKQVEHFTHDPKSKGSNLDTGTGGESMEKLFLVVSSCWTDDNVNFKQDVYLSTTVNYKCNLPMKYTTNVTTFSITAISPITV